MSASASASASAVAVASSAAPSVPNGGVSASASAAAAKPKPQPSALVSRAMAHLSWRSATPIDAVLKRQQQKAAEGTAPAPSTTAAAAAAGAPATSPAVASAAASSPAASTNAPAAAVATTTAAVAAPASAPVWKKQTAAAAAAAGLVIGAAVDDGSLPAAGGETHTHVFDVFGASDPTHPPLRLLQRKEFGISGWVWPCAMVLTKYLIRRDLYPREWWRGKRVLELGSGTGLVGLVAAWCGAGFTTLTDIALNTPLLTANVQLNCDAELQSRVAVCDYLWNTPTDRLLVAPPVTLTATPETTALAKAAAAIATSGPTVASGGTPVGAAPAAASSSGAAEAKRTAALTGPYDVIIGSDLAYKPEYLLDLYASLNALSDANTVILMAQEERCVWKEKPFFDAMQNHFTVMRIADSELDPVYQADDIAVYRIVRKPPSATTTAPAAAATVAPSSADSKTAPASAKS